MNSRRIGPECSPSMSTLGLALEAKNLMVSVCILGRLTFDMRGGRQLAKPDVGRPLDGRVRRLCVRGMHWCKGGTSFGTKVNDTRRPLPCHRLLRTRARQPQPLFAFRQATAIEPTLRR